MSRYAKVAELTAIQLTLTQENLLKYGLRQDPEPEANGAILDQHLFDKKRQRGRLWPLRLFLRQFTARTTRKGHVSWMASVRECREPDLWREAIGSSTPFEAMAEAREYLSLSRVQISAR
jgi:hypothetical protein